MKKTSRKKKTAAAQGSKQASGSRAKSKQSVAKKAGAKSAKKGGPANDRTHLPLPAGANWLDEVYARRRPCTDFTVAEAGQQVAVTGWAFRYRDQGGCVFVDLRDRSGLIQAVFDLSVLGDRFGEAERIRHEFVIAVEGKLRSRTPENINPKLKTGDIEILVQRFEILSKAETPPITLEEHVEVHEDTRLKYRYLDMRRMHMFYALQSRSRLNQALRSGLEAQGFIEVETPVLNKSTPEGARDFLVPARQSPGAFYALPQSPQLFKQLLMMGGVERYFQIVKCFRDEDFRADRQPEFTQLDLEMSFVNEEIVMHTMERLWAGALESTFNIQVSLPVSRLSYRDAMELYGKDAPDLRYDMKLVDVADIAAESDFKVFKEIAKGSGRVKVLPVPGGAKLSRKDIDDLTAWVG
ncbi:MAG: aspartate--tRNA ligase, partial [Leptospiraceae bacterium]|nr:aspartate--tRNA ligase [Leptospiraceae bacterium]